jgi:UDP-N-acetylmuramate--alanine ligase
VTYGVSRQADFRAKNIRFEGLKTRFEALRHGETLGDFVVGMPGAHNVLNALAVVAVADELAIPFAHTKAALADFAGVQRRFTVRGEAKGALVVDDYGHHPAEIKATLAGARASFPDRRIVVAFQPHRYTRTRDLMGEFATAFNDADALFLTEIYAASEDPIPGVSGAKLAEAVQACGHRDVVFVERPGLAARLAAKARPDDLIITLGAGDITHVGEELLALLGGASAPGASGGHT